MATDLNNQTPLSPAEAAYASLVPSNSRFNVTSGLFGVPAPALQAMQQGAYVPFSSLLEPFGARGFGNYGFGPGTPPPAPMPSAPGMGGGLPQGPSWLNQWYGQPTAPAPANASSLQSIIEALGALLGQGRPTTQAAAQAFQQRAANAYMGGDLSAASGAKAQQVRDLYSSIGRTGALAPSDAEVAFWASQPQTGDALRQRFLESASTFSSDPVYGSAGQTASGMLSSAAAPAPAPAPAPSADPLEAVRQAFLAIPGANPNPDAATLQYYATQGLDKLASDVAYIRATNPEVAAQIDAQRAQLGL